MGALNQAPALQTPLLHAQRFHFGATFLLGILVVISFFVQLGVCFRGDPMVRSFSSYLRRSGVPLQSDTGNQLDGIIRRPVQAVDTTITELPSIGLNLTTKLEIQIRNCQTGGSVSP
jgi:hypothetical protein